MKNGKFLRKLLSAVCCLAMVVTMLPIAPAAAAEDTLLIAPNPNAGTTISGGSLSSFSDAAEITYTKAAEVTAGLGLFAGAGGKFMPKSNLTRAQMATIIVKMLNGSDANADSFKGTGKFSDTAIFEGGWAEGYINWCATLGIVSGYGDGTFKPGNMVTAAEAATMILNALKVDAGAGTWPHTVMAKAEELDMFDDLLTKPANDKALTREELAVMALVGLEYSPEGKQGYEYNGVTYDSFMDAYMVAGPTNAGKINPTAGDSLAGKVFEMQTFEGFIVDNQATDPELAGLTVVSKKVDGVNVDKTFFIPTGLEHVGHYVTVYYSEPWTSEKNPGLTYTIYDETQVFAVDEEITAAKEYKKVFDRSYKAADKVALFGGNYVSTDLAAGTLSGYTAGSAAKEGTYFVYDGAIVGYMAPVTVYASKVTAVNTYEGSQSITLKGVLTPISNSEDDDRIVEYKGIAKDDYVTYTLVGEEGSEIYVLSQVTTVTGSVTKLSSDKNGARVTTVKGAEYVTFGAENNNTGLSVEDVTDFSATYTFYVTADGKYVGWERSEGTADLKNTVFILGQTSVVARDSYGKQVQTTYARGVDMDGKEVMLPVRVQSGAKDGNGEFVADGNVDVYDGVDNGDEYAAVSANTFYRIEKSTDREAKKEDLYALTAITKEYDEKTQPLFFGTTTTKAGVEFTQNPTVSGIGTVFRQSSTLNIIVDGDLSQTTPLTATVKKGSMNGVLNTTGETVTRYMLLSKSGLSTYVDVIVICQNGIDNTLSAETVYISDAAVADVSLDANGYVYDVYDYKTGAVKQVTMELAIDEYVSYDGAGYYQLVPVADSEAVELGSKATFVEAFTGKPSNSGADGLYYENVAYDQVLSNMSTSYFTTVAVGTGAKGLTNGAGAAKGVVVDLRDEETIVAHGVGKIDSLSRIADLILESPQIIIPFDLCYSTNSDTLLTVFVKDVYFGTPDTGVELVKKGADYYLNGYAVAANVEVSGRGFTSVGQIYDVLNPDQAPEGYPPNEPANIDLTFSLEGGKVAAIKVTSYSEAGVYGIDDFEAYEEGEFFNSPVALEKGWTFGGSGTLNAEIEKEGGNKYLSVTTSKPSFNPGGSVVPDGAFSLKFDFMRTANESGTFYTHVGTYTGGDGKPKYINFVAFESGVFGLVDSGMSAGGGQNFVVLKDGKLNDKGQDNNPANSNSDAAKLDANTWYTVEMIVDAEADTVRLKVAERDDADNILCELVKEFVADFNYRVVTFAPQVVDKIGNASTPSVALDNVSYTAVRDWEYPIYVDSPEGAEVTASPAKAATGETVTLSCELEDEDKYAVDYYTVNGQPIKGDTFVMGTDPVTVSAVLARSYAVELTQPNGVSVEANAEYAAAGAKIEITGTCTGGYYKFASVTVTKAGGGTVEAEVTGKLTAEFEMPAEDVTVSVTLADDSVVFEDDFSSYNVGQFVKEGVSANQGARYAVCSGQKNTGFEAEVTEGKELKAAGGRLYLGQKVIPAAGTYSYEFDIKLTGDPNATIYRIGDSENVTASGGAWRVYIHKTSNKIYLNRETSKDREGKAVATAAYYLKTDGTFGDSTNAVTVGIDEWWHIAVTVDYDGFVTISAGKKGGPAVSGTYNIGEPFVALDKNGSAMLDLNTNSGNGPIYIDKIEITKVWAD